MNPYYPLSSVLALVVVFMLHRFIRAELEGYRNAFKILGLLVLASAVAVGIALLNYRLGVPTPILFR